MLWATDFFPLWKKVSGVHILLAIRLLSGRMFIGPLNFNLSSFQLWRKKTSIVYSWGRRQKKISSNHWIFCFCLPVSWKWVGLVQNLYNRQDNPLLCFRFSTQDLLKCGLFVAYDSEEGRLQFQHWPTGARATSCSTIPCHLKKPHANRGFSWREKTRNVSERKSPLLFFFLLLVTVERSLKFRSWETKTKTNINRDYKMVWFCMGVRAIITPIVTPPVSPTQTALKSLIAQANRGQRWWDAGE